MSGRLVFTGGGWITEPEQRSRRARIIDAHTHVFPPLLSQEEGIPPELRRQIWQFHSREFNNWWRVSDGRHVDRRFLEFDADDIDQMPDVDFRLTDFGKARITVDGEDYEMHFYTPNLVNNELPPERVGQHLRNDLPHQIIVAMFDERLEKWTNEHPLRPSLLKDDLDLQIFLLYGQGEPERDYKRIRKLREAVGARSL